MAQVEWKDAWERECWVRRWGANTRAKRIPQLCQNPQQLRKHSILRNKLRNKFIGQVLGRLQVDNHAKSLLSLRALLVRRTKFHARNSQAAYPHERYSSPILSVHGFLRGLDIASRSRRNKATKTSWFPEALPGSIQLCRRSAFIHERFLHLE